MKKIFLLGFLIVSTNIPAQKKPAIFLIIVDDLRPELGAYGSELAITPTLDSLANNGLTCTNAFSQQALCGPSRASFLTGLRPSTLGIQSNREKISDHPISLHTIPGVFKKDGYRTVGIGKVFHHLDDQFCVWDTPPIQYAFEDRYHDISNKEREKGPAYERLDVEDTVYIDGKSTDIAITIIQEWHINDPPLFMSIGYNKPHLPYTAPTKYWGIYDSKIQGGQSVACSSKPKDSPNFAISGWNELHGYEGFRIGKRLTEKEKTMLLHGYLACVSYIDSQLKQLMNAIGDSRIDEYVVVIMGDHGYKLGEYNSWSKHTNYGVDNRTPLIFNGPSIKSGTIDHPVELIDVFPTLLNLSNSQQPELSLPGKNLFSYQEDQVSRSEPFALSSYPRNLEKQKVVGYSLLFQEYRVIKWENEDGSTHSLELYDIRTDPNECVNIVSTIADDALQGILETTDSLLIEAHKKDSHLLDRFTSSSPRMLEVYPSPTSSHIYISQNACDVLHIYTLNGVLVKTIYSLNSYESQSVSDLEAGLYIVRGFNGERQYSGRFIKE